MSKQWHFVVDELNDPTAGNFKEGWVEADNLQGATAEVFKRYPESRNWEMIEVSLGVSYAKGENP